MMSKINKYSLKVKTGRTERPIPMVNDIYLHSLYDPLREADSFIQKNRERILDERYFLVLGLGFAYHIKRLISELKNRQLERWGIVVIEPNINTFTECVKRKLIPGDKELRVFKGMDVDKLYEEKDLIDFMMLKPTVLVHDASYNLYLDYYKKFLNHKAETENALIAPKVKNAGIQQCLLDFGNSDINNLKENIKDKSILTREEILLGAFFSICE